MRITLLIENTSRVGMPVEHGLSLHIALNGRQILFDMGQGNLFADNAKRLGVSVKDVDLAVISHGHYDHGGGLGQFLELNSKAPVYIHKNAFLPHYSMRDDGLKYIGLDATLQNNPRIMLCDDTISIDNVLTLFSGVNGTCCNPRGNRLLYGPSKSHNDLFVHEQNLLIKDGENVVLIAGCAHCGIVNIMRRVEVIAGQAPTHVFAGMHLVKSGLSEDEESTFISCLAEELMRYSHCRYYTMHCTGLSQYERLKSIMNSQIVYLSCGESVWL